MSFDISRRPSAALVISIVALFVALGGGAYAAGKLKPNSVKGKNVKDNSLKGADIDEVTLNGALIPGIPSGGADGAGTGAAGGDLAGNYPNPTIKNNAVTAAKIGTGAVTATKMGTITERTADMVVAATSNGGDGALQAATATATCDPGEIALSGGGRTGTAAIDTQLLESHRGTGQTWVVKAANDSAVADTVRAYVYCLAP